MVVCRVRDMVVGKLQL